MTVITPAAVTLDPVWERKYASGHQERYPWDVVVSFVFRNRPRERPTSDVTILEVGFGTGNNLWFAAREGFRVCGVEGSASAVTNAQRRFVADRLEGDLRVGDFTDLPFATTSVDLAIDRGSLTCAGRTAAHRAVTEIHRVLRTGGRFLFNGYSDACTSAQSGWRGADDLQHDISEGSLTGVGQLCFWNEAQVRTLFAGWTVLSMELMERRDLVGTSPSVHAEWRVVVEKSA
jgi:SAM-dependent methyltransferase